MTKRNLLKLLGLGVAASLLSLLLLGFVGFLRPHQTIVGPALQPSASLAGGGLDEASGLTQSLQYPGVLWTHGDSGNEARLFALNSQGQLISQFEVQGATLRDWEAITQIGDRLLVADTGNSFNSSRELGMLVVREPSPKQSGTVRAERFLKLKYPDQESFPPSGSWHFDCEAVFARGERIYLVTKDRPAYRFAIQQGTAHLYGFSADSLDEDEETTLESLDFFDGLEGWVTAADLSPDSKTLALLCESPVQSVWLFELPDEGERFLSKAKKMHRFRFHNAKQIEAMAFLDDERIMILNEDQDVFLISRRDFQEVE